MNAELYLAFVLASVVLIISPGPSVGLIVATSLRRGTRSGLAAVAGTSGAEVILLSMVVVGLTAMAAFLAGVFEWVRWLGVAYLLYLAFKAWRIQPALVEDAQIHNSRFFWQGFVVSLFNPKTLLFHGAFLPQFIDPSLPVFEQSLVLAVTFLFIQTALDCGWAFCAGWVRPHLIEATKRRVASRLSAIIYAIAAAGLAAARR